MSNIKPTTVQGQTALRTIYYKAKLMRICKGLFKIECGNLWDKNYIANCLCGLGYLAIVRTERYGLLPLYCSPIGTNYFYAPIEVSVTAPKIKNEIYKLGVDAELIFLDRLWQEEFFNYQTIVDYYAEILASADCNIAVNLLTSTTGWIAEADSDAQAKTIKDAFSKIVSGEPLVVGKKESLSKDGLQVFFNNLKNNFIANDVVLTKNNILNQFYTDIGIKSANTDKKERLISPEVDSIDSILQVNTGVIRQNLESCMNKVWETFPELRGEFNITLNDFVGVKDEIHRDDVYVGDTAS